MIAILNTADITDVEYPEDWTVLEYDSNNEEGSSLAAIEFIGSQPQNALHVFTSSEFEQFKKSSVWKAEE